MPYERLFESRVWFLLNFSYILGKVSYLNRVCNVKLRPRLKTISGPPNLFISAYFK